MEDKIASGTIKASKDGLGYARYGAGTSFLYLQPIVTAIDPLIIAIISVIITSKGKASLNKYLICLFMVDISLLFHLIDKNIFKIERDNFK